MDASTTVPLHTGRRMPVLGLGTWELTRDTADTVHEALQMGYRMIDTADDYGSQPGIGKALARDDVDRDDVYLVAKVEEDEDGWESTRKSLGEMGQERADLMLVHRPPKGEDIGAGIWEGLVRAREEGLTRDIGVSNYAVDELERFIAETGEIPVVNQIEWTPFGWSREMLEYCRSRDIVIQAYSPLTRAERLGDERLTGLADEAGGTPAQVLLKWCLERGVVPLPKANQVDHLRENLGTFDVALSPEQMEAMDALDERWSALAEAPMHL